MYRTASNILITHPILRIWPPSDYHLFPGLKKQSKGRHFSSDVDVIVPRRPGWTGNLLNFFFSGLQKLEQRAKKCVELRGECVE